MLNKYLFNDNEVTEGEPGYRVQTVKINEEDEKVFQKLEDRIIANISTKNPTLVAINMKTLYPELNDANHMIIIIGYSIEGNAVKDFYYIDPFYKVQDEQNKGLKIVSSNLLMQALVNNDEPAYIW